MRAITLWPEWAWAITALGKNVENRTWRPRMKLGDRFAIHAGATFGGGSGKGQSWMQILAGVILMAERAGWKIGYDRDRHVLHGYRTDRHQSFDQKVHEIPTGSLVAVVDFVGILEQGDDEAGFPWWAADQLGWAFTGMRALPDPVKCRGKQGFWTVPDDVWEQAANQVAEPGQEA